MLLRFGEGGRYTRNGLAVMTSGGETFRVTGACAGPVTWSSAPISLPALPTVSALEAIIGDAQNRSLRDGVAETVDTFRKALPSGLSSFSEP